MAVSYYTVRPGESLIDVTLNSTGNKDNADKILEENGIAEWSPILATGRVLTIPDTVVVDANALRELTKYPSYNNFNKNITKLLDDVVNLLDNIWILQTGNWNENGVWLNEGTWNL